MNILHALERQFELGNVIDVGDILNISLIDVMIIVDLLKPVLCQEALREGTLFGARHLRRLYHLVENVEVPLFIVLKAYAGLLEEVVYD